MHFWKSKHQAYYPLPWVSLFQAENFHACCYKTNNKKTVFQKSLSNNGRRSNRENIDKNTKSTKIHSLVGGAKNMLTVSPEEG